ERRARTCYFDRDVVRFFNPFYGISLAGWGDGKFCHAPIAGGDKGVEPDYGGWGPGGQTLHPVHGGCWLFHATHVIYRSNYGCHPGVYRADLDFQMSGNRRGLRHRHAAPRRGRRIGRLVMEISATMASFLTHVRVEKGLSLNTVAAYRRDLA